jgi:hypothetical protein
MAAAKPRLPPRSVTDWKESHIELAITAMNDLANYPVRFLSESCISGKEARLISSVHEIHVCRTSPSVYGVPAPLMTCDCCMNDHISNSHLAIGWQWTSL